MQKVASTNIVHSFAKCLAYMCIKIGTIKNMLIQINANLLKNRYNGILYKLNIICLKYLAVAIFNIIHSKYLEKYTCVY